MKREEAVNVLKEILFKCTSVNGNYLALMPSGSDNILSNGYQIHLKTHLSQLDKMCIRGLLSEHGLELKETSEKTIIFQPLKKNF